MLYHKINRYSIEQRKMKNGIFFEPNDVLWTNSEIVLALEEMKCVINRETFYNSIGQRYYYSTSSGKYFIYYDNAPEYPYIGMIEDTESFIESCRELIEKLEAGESNE